MPVHLVTGFLGSGKTTLVNRLLREPRLRHTAVVVNEFGEVGVDHLLVRDADDVTVALAGGCLCCEIRDDLALTLEDLLRRRELGLCMDFRRIVIETTGVAAPAPVLDLLRAAPALAARTRAGCVVTVVDACDAQQTLGSFPEAVEQVALASHVVISKWDLTEPGPARALVQRLNPAARLWCGNDAVGGIGQALIAWQAGRSTSSRDLGESPSGHVHLDAGGIRGFQIRRESPLPGAALPLFTEALAEHLGPDLLRVKGLLAVDNAPQQPLLYQGARETFYSLQRLAAWPDRDRSSRLQFIVRGDWQAFLERLLDAVVWEVAQLEADAAGDPPHLRRR
jgi:G3E family GTPase